MSKKNNWQEQQEKNRENRICCICKQTTKKSEWLSVVDRCKECQYK